MQTATRCSMRLIFVLWLWTVSALAGEPLRFQVTLDESVAPDGSSGRLFVLMSDRPGKQNRLGIGFAPGRVWLAAMEVEHFTPGSTIDFNPDYMAFPRPFSKAGPGNYQFMALLDPDHSYALTRQDEGDLYGPVVAVQGLDPANAAEPVRLLLSKRTPARPKFQETNNIKLVELESSLLTAFWGRRIPIRAAIVLPPGYQRIEDRKYPASYVVHGFGGNHIDGARSQGPELVESMRSGKRMEMVHVFLDASFPTGHHVFADSANNGPWGQALTEEFIPYLEKKYRLIPESRARFLTGHSSGGWSTLWLQVTYPDFFGGVWSTAPDPVDFRSFTGVDVSPGSTENVYRKRDGTTRNLIRRRGRELVSFEDFARMEEVAGEFGGQMASFESVWSPRGNNGGPMRLFNRLTGEQDPEVQEAWRKYDIRYILEENWPTLAPRLKGKLHLIVGAEDTFHLEEAVVLLCDFLKIKGEKRACEIVPGRDHTDLYRSHHTYPEGLSIRIDNEMRKVWTTVPSQGSAGRNWPDLQ